jgi:hypothetical protein
MRCRCGSNAKVARQVAVRSLEPQLLHIHLVRASEGICKWPAELRTVVGQELRKGEQGEDRRLEGGELRLEVVIELDNPTASI